MGEFRERVVRLAYARPEIRPCVAPLLREAFLHVRMPRGGEAFEYEGPGAMRAGEDMAKLTRALLTDVQAQDREAWEEVGRVLIELSHVDAMPEMSRKVIGDAFAGVYRDAQRQVEGWYRRKASSFSFGFSGPGAEAASDKMVLALARGVREVEGRSTRVRAGLLRALDANVQAGIDPSPVYARTVVGHALRDTYELMSFQVRAYFRQVGVAR